MPFVIIGSNFFFTGYWHFENGVTRFVEDVLLDPDGLPHVLDLVVHLVIFGFLGGGIIPRPSFY